MLQILPHTFYGGMKSRIFIWFKSLQNFVVCLLNCHSVFGIQK